MNKGLKFFITGCIFLITVELFAQTGNTLTGYGAGYSITSGTNNTINGYLAGYKLTSGNKNTFTGASSGYYNTTGSNNSFHGYSSGYYNTTGSENTFNGYYSGRKNTSGNGNVFNGYLSGSQNTSGSSNCFDGWSSGYSNTSGWYNCFSGYKGGYLNTTGTGNVFIGYYAGNTNTTGYYNICIGYGANVSNSALNNAIAIGYNSSVSASNSLVLGNGANVGIGTSAPAYQFQLSKNNAAKPGSSTWTIASDLRLKKDITDFNDGLNVLEKIHPVCFTYNGEAGMPINQKFVGIIAQEINEIAPYMVGSFYSQDSTGNMTEYLDYDANALFYILVNSVKEQQKNIEQKEAELRDLEQVLALFRNEIDSLLNAIPDITNADKSNFSFYQYSESVLEQNYPNPFSKTTTIKYFIRQDVKNAIIVLSSINGKEIQRYLINNNGVGQIEIPSNSLAQGNYLYQLITDGILIDTKKLEIIN